MKQLQTIQKTFRVFQILAKVGMILSFVWAGLVLLGLLCGIVWYTGGIVVGASEEVLFSLTAAKGLAEMMGALLIDLVFALTDGILLAFAFRYFKAEQEEGTPFTEAGATRIQRLGVRTIVLPLVAVILAAVFSELFGLPRQAGDWSNLPSLTLGIVLILASLIFRYGAELEQKSNS